jgi:hypothetical protein
VEVHVQTAVPEVLLVVQATLGVLNVQLDITIMDILILDVLPAVQLKKEPLSVVVDNVLVIVTEVLEVIHARDI